MAKKDKPENEPETGPEEAQDATSEEVTDTTDETSDETSEDPTGAGAPDADERLDADEEPIAQDEPGALDGAATGEADGPETAPADEDVAPEAEAAPVPAVQPEPVVIRKGGFLPMLLGGVAAAAIGFGAARYMLPEGWPWPGADDGFEAAVSARLDEQAGAIEALRAAEPDLGPVEDHLAGLQGAMDGLVTRVDAMGETLGGLEARLTDLEKRPITEGASPAAVAAYERELKAVQDAMAAQRAEIEALLADAARMEANAEMTAQEAAQRAAVTRILTALDTGTGFAAAADDLGQLGIALAPELQAAAADGVDTMAELADAFPEAARAALDVARRAEGGGGFGSFLKTQLGARSLEPREGDDPDAILSRAEAAVREGRLADALAEIETLPEAAQGAMQGWIDRARGRIGAVAAAEALNAELTSNRG